jgi:hypothetical protein
MPLPPASLLLTDPNEHAAAMAGARQVLEGSASVLLQEDTPPLIAAALAVADHLGDSDKRVAPAHLLWYIALNPSIWPIGEIIGAKYIHNTTPVLEPEPFQLNYLLLDGLLACCKTTAPVQEHVAVMIRFLWDLIDVDYAKWLDDVSKNYAVPFPYCPNIPAYSPPPSPYRANWESEHNFKTRRSSVRSFLAKVRIEELGRREAQLLTEAAADAALRTEVSALLAAAAPVMRIAQKGAEKARCARPDLLTPTAALVEAALRFMQEQEGDATDATPVPSTEKLPQRSITTFAETRIYPLLPDPKEHAAAMAEVQAALEGGTALPHDLKAATALVAARLEGDNDNRVAPTHLLWYIAQKPSDWPTHRIINVLDDYRHRHFRVNDLLDSLLTACETTSGTIEEHSVAMIRFLSDIVELKHTQDLEHQLVDPDSSPYDTNGCRPRLLAIMVKKNTEELELRIAELCTRAVAHAHLMGKVHVLLNSAAPVLHMAQEVASAAPAVPALRGADLLAPAIALVDAALLRLQEDPSPSAGKRARIL